MTPRVDRLRAVNLPRRVVVELDAEGRPVAVVIDGKREAGSGKRPPPSPPRLAVEGVGEVWRIDDEWWRRPIARRYVEVMLNGGGRVMLYEDLVTGEWFVQTP